MDTLIQASITYEIRTRVTQITATVTMVIAVWTFALWLIFGLQPKLAIAVLIGATVLTVAGLVLQAYDRQSHEKWADPHVRSPPTVNG